MSGYVGGVPAATRWRVLAGASAHFGVGVDALLSRNRRVEVCEARQMVMAVLYGMQYGCQAIGLALARDHSTVLHGIKRALATPEQVTIRDWLIADLGAVELDCDPGPLLGVALAMLPEAEAREIVRFLDRCCLRGGSRRDLDPRRGLFALAARPRVAAQVERVLTSCGKPGAAWLLQRALVDLEPAV